MDDAEQSLRDGDLAEAIDNQSQAMEALRDSMRSLGEALAEEQRSQQPGQGTQEGDRRAENRDPLGRSQGSNGATGSDNDAVRWIIANRADLEALTLTRLAADKLPAIRVIVAQHPATPDDVRQQLRRDLDEDVRQAAETGRPPQP